MNSCSVQYRTVLVQFYYHKVMDSVSIIEGKTEKTTSDEAPKITEEGSNVEVATETETENRIAEVESTS